MSLVFAGITPHPPLLIPNIGKEKIDLINKTKEALESLEKEIYVSKAQLIIVISPHSSLYKESFSVNANTHFVSAYDNFGDLSTVRDWKGSPDFAAKLSQACKTKKINLQLGSQEKLDHGATVPLFYLTNHLKDVQILPLGYSHRNAMEHIHFGEILKDVIEEDHRRIAVIASGDLSHKLPKKKSKKENFDEKLIYLIKEKLIGSILDLDSSESLKNAEECGYRSILILLGVLKETDYSFESSTYEHPFGVGYLTGSFDF
ncbi:MAG: AmmeMemoRadiSam system protein B [Candidatus Magasanikbacteria bacterium RIFCSPHIGHO2_01_FULL_33_34]|uniref:AmmeMemoRadiSam system protein B n=1 Tax=Candidatus Magasanikbacteria bacterium RIFCSPHIGHO2_01_FULL_33_34 TaxID=1798671 RepID=A0A1F6LL45_9BACT|nr:MAG: AmmeMemoRadiSam system protein B [Candidatus Magasanikbacteria bacterium RIFCSPHIGHO2_01_FULL_33_34]OGH65833.1 MAG: AmmeMemoRadiSam system protein B [Candidatus Magasanikbacteria bacterium RIFCSPHIGHO2_02_FULL_33_17]OGH75198.1 MAG: AmmeMemoRadiSam system protein B [Candidatus Magasanikbacteria bacterium RIFCSPLOWO2_01_FULL_33_34]